MDRCTGLIVVGVGCETGEDGVSPMRVVTSALPLSDLDSLARKEIRLWKSADPEVSIAPFGGPVKNRSDVSDEGSPLLLSWTTKRNQ